MSNSIEAIPRTQDTSGAASDLAASDPSFAGPDAAPEAGRHSRFPKGVVRFMVAQLRFWAPVILVLAMCELILWQAGETWPVQRVLSAQQAQPNVIWMRQYMDQSFYAYKYAALVKRRPTVVALGSSRVMKFRAAMFGSDAERFYNAGGMIQNLHDLNAFVETVPPDVMPETVILGVDMWWLNDNWKSEEDFSSGIKDDGTGNWQNHLSSIRRLVEKPKRLAQQGFSALSTPPGQRLGFEARAKNLGFRADGSIHYGNPVPATPAAWEFVDRERPPVVQWIKRGVRRFERTSGISNERLALLKSALLGFKQRGVFVMGFMPAVSSEAAALLEKTPGQRELWTEYRRQVPALFAELDIPFVDASTTDRLELDDRYLVDGIHAEEMFHWHLMKRFLSDSRVRAALPTALPAVEQALDAPGGNFWFTGTASD